ncbi:hypothetical protein VOLCADRAFT_98500 [Volvox carteri f. nagariensis]|uniref:Peptidase M14 domain-containing protein n=1 Tax=Volvox carteri f. nagariensis TaxID=3068 RepID=D8UFI1_VOLCA|nr:uncharacterized protein VOLCADRAFT_98500 [Volvox carteri f. nagariensis]EFJ41462.1 hypothetical protein VOLCADRAFT_98500 [Volvox carteri f. nagariensis]|eukprot:XP_002957407.1 hypothetical protein VOLCADRAFT_98500 [Volvox carteri f. nagariensis]
MSLLRSLLAWTLLFLVVPLTNSHEDYSSLGDLLHWYAHAAQMHPSLVRYTELREPGFEHTVLPLASFSNYDDVEVQSKVSDKPSVLLVFGEHARELITCEVGLWLSRVLVGDTAEISKWAEWPEAFKPLGIGPQDVAATVQGWVRRILDNLVVKVLPIENVDGRQAWEAGNLCLRKTSKGVDLNRNYPFAFASEPPSSEMFGGPYPFSEAQSRLIARLALEGGRVPKGYINVHSGEWAVYSGWDSKSGVGPGLPEDLSDLLIRSGDVCRCQAGPAGAVSNYLAFGTGMDFMYTQLGVPYALTYEVYGQSNVFSPGEPGRIPEGTRNKPLSEYSYMTDSGIAATVPHIQDLLPLVHTHQHHYHQNAQSHFRTARQHSNRATRLTRTSVSSLRRSAGVRGVEDKALAGSGAVAGKAAAGAGASLRERQTAMGSRGLLGWWLDAARRVGRMMLSNGGEDGGVGSSGRALLQSSSAAVLPGSALAELPSQLEEPSQLQSGPRGMLGGRSMRRLQAAMNGSDGSAAAAATAATAALVGAAGASTEALGSGPGGRELQQDTAALLGPEGHILAMVRRQPGMQQGCFDMFNPPPGTAYRDVISRWVVILLMTLDHVADPANPRPSPHPLPGTVLAGMSTGPWLGTGLKSQIDAAAVSGLGRRLLEVPAGGEEGAGQIEGRDGAGQDFGANAVEEEEEEEAGLGSQGDHAGETTAGQAGAGGKGREGELYGSAGFDRRAHQQVYEVDPVMRQHSLVVLVALCFLGIVFVPWFMCAANQVSRPLPLASRRSRQQLGQQPPPQPRVCI